MTDDAQKPTTVREWVQGSKPDIERVPSPGAKQDEWRSKDPVIADLFQQMIEAGSDEMDFHMHRKPEPGKTFSEDGLRDLAISVQTFIGARIAARFRDLPEGDPGPSDVHVTMSIALDGKTFVIPEELRPWYATDGSHREDASRASSR